MRRQINLLNLELLKRRDYLNAQLLVRLPAGVLLLLLCFFAYSRNQEAVLIKQADQAAQQMKDAQARLVQATQQYAPRQPSKSLQEAVVLAEARLGKHQQILGFLQQDKTGAHAGFSSYMRAFSRKSISALWLTGFSIDHDSNEMTLSGRALQAELVPQYISQLGQDAALKGRTFSALSMRIPIDQAAVSAAGATPVATAISPPLRFIEFELKSSSRQGDKPGAGGGTS